MAENPSCSSCISFPRLDVLRVRPHQVSHGSFVRNLLFPVDESHLVDGGQVWRESSMDAEHGAIDNGAEREVVKSLVEVFPAVGVAILFVDFVQEAIHHGDVSALVIAPEQVDSVWVLDFEAEQKCDGLD